MNRLIQELRRLYLPPGSALTPDLVAAQLAGDVSLPLDPVDANAQVRTLLVSFRNSSDWPLVAKLNRCVQEELGLPAPAISVSGCTGFQLWLSLAQPQAPAQAGRFLEALRRRCLGEMPVAALGLHPVGTGNVPALPTPLELVPALDQVSGRWSAFIDPSMGSMFIDEGGLESAPNMDAQAELLARLHSIKADDFDAALRILESPVSTDGDVKTPATGADNVASTGADRRSAAHQLNLGGGFADPQSFLLAVMNDPSASAKQRIKAAKALLPYFERS
ncbi:hypothetical protein [Rhodocyclus tenuis]|uniref:Uncharacterized protein n=1 Tax=Rhodocyclus tenuis TaxID=1066 RepID=A0A840G1Z0_RHOTE|nr:hypothetical protein [Rhodocyclus tenuis]MBB4248417.1 hypothetical protein [Rhodocyclus tenuis]